MAVIFKLSRQIEGQIDEFLKLVNESGLIFKKAINYYLYEEREAFNSSIELVSKYERKADKLLAETEKQLYLKTLIPDNRGDVLAILENTDSIIDSMKATLLFFSVENPEIPSKFNALFNELTVSSVQSVEWLIQAIGSFFRDLKRVNFLIEKVTQYEKETDEIAIRLKRLIFKDDIDLSHKLHLRYFANNIEQLSDYAELVGEMLAIYTIKRFV